MNNKYLNIKQSMNYLGIKSYSTWSKLIKSGLPVIEVSTGFKRVDKDDLDKWLKSNKNNK